MPLSKARDKARKRLQRAQNVLGIVQPELYLKPVQPEIPFYDPLIHKKGDKVLIWQDGKQVEVIVP